MDLNDLEQLAEILGLEGVTADPSRGWVSSKCPFAMWTHKKGTDSRPSFGMSTGGGEHPPSFNCFACGQKGTLFDLIATLQFYRGTHLKKASRFLQKFGSLGGESSPNEKKRSRSDKFLELFEKERLSGIPVPDDILAKYPLLYPNREAPEAIYDYLELERKISPKVSEAYQLRAYVNQYGQFGIIFPIISRTSGKTLDLWVRMISTKSNFRLTPEMSGSPVAYTAPNLWFGNQFYKPKSSIILVEGAFDLLRLKSFNLDANVYASFGSPTKRQLEQIYAPTIYFGFDADEAGRKFTELSISCTSSIPQRFILNWGFVNKKDAGELASNEELLLVLSRRVALSPPRRHPVTFEFEKNKKKRR